MRFASYEGAQKIMLPLRIGDWAYALNEAWLTSYYYY